MTAATVDRSRATAAALVATLKVAVAFALERGMLEDVDPETITYIVGRETVIPSRQRDGLARWRKKVFAFMARNSERTAVYFGVPTAQAVELGLEIEL